MPSPVASLELLARMRRGDAVALGRLISRAEAGAEEARAALAEVYEVEAIVGA